MSYDGIFGRDWYEANEMRIDFKSKKIFLLKAADGEDCEILNEMDENACA